MTSFSSLVERIAGAYNQLDHELGWRFLYSPSATLSPATQLALVGLNPGGGTYHPPAPSVEAGNAYRLERWASSGGLNTLQVQVGRLYEALAERLELAPARLMDETMTANFCPFRSPSWNALPNRDWSVEFSSELWTDILRFVEPSVMVCLGELAARYISGALESTGSRPLGRPRVGPVGWGSVTYGLTAFGSSSGQTLVVRLPHLSRFAFFGRPASRSAVAHLATEIEAALDSARTLRCQDHS